MSVDRRIRVVYADDDISYRTRLLRSLIAEPSIEVVAVTVDGEAALTAIKRHEPDVALLDLSTPGVSGLDIAEQVAQLEPAVATRVLLLTALPVDSTGRVRQAVGPRGVVDRASSRSEIVASLANAAG